ncbi:uncharacterized protein LOC121735342 isoform X2 [Aricia agestis]|uniref:uncharacterized protein LOC121735342 isoform X2 n=1 Tax=Aricia agestis TaxID=91739 RepID=UPI001C20B87E|nr:uncharacterized protein LOC121735342 isoform X2 [Aricia agestis]
MATDLNESFIAKYESVNTKLKKRFLRKPNVSEATNEFVALAIECEHSEQPAFAGQIYIGAAKCEASAGNELSEAEHYLSAARQFIKAEKKLFALKFDSPDRENLEAAICCYMKTLNKYPEKSPLRASVLLELANNLVDLNHRQEAIVYYEQALNNITDKTTRLMCLRDLMNIQIDCDKYDAALETTNSIHDGDFHIPEGILSELQVTRVLLGLIVEPEEDGKPESLRKLYDDILNDEDNGLPFNPDLKLKLQSIIISCGISDKQSLVNIFVDTKQHLTTQQIHLMEALIQSKE